MSVAEGVQEIGRAGAISAKRLLQQVLGEAIDLAFNAYDHPDRLAFDEEGGTQRSFRFDLGGVLKRRNADRFDHQEAVDVFVEVKTKTFAGDLLADYRTFLRHAAIACAEPRYRTAWFVFYSTVPFGSSRAAELVNGTLLKECSDQWPEHLRPLAASLRDRIVLVVATESFARLLTAWGRNAA